MSLHLVVFIEIWGLLPRWQKDRMTYLVFDRPRWPYRYSDTLRARVFGVRTLVETRRFIPLPLWPALEPTQPSVFCEMDTGFLSRGKVAGTCHYSSTLIWRRYIGMLLEWPLPLSFTWLFEKKFVFVGYRRVESRIIGIALDDDIFDRMGMALTEVLCVREIQAMSLRWHKTFGRNG